MKKLLKFLLILVVLLVVLVALLPMVAGGWIQSKAEASISESMDAEASFGSFDFGWLSGLNFTNLEIDGRQPQAPDLKVASFSAKPGLLALLKGDVVIEDAVARGVVVTTRSAPAAPSETPAPAPDDAPAETPKKPAETPSPEGATELPLNLDVAVAIEDLTLVHENPAWPAAFAIRSFERVEATVKTGAPATFRLADQGLELSGTAEVFDGRKIKPTDAITADGYLKAPGADLTRYAAALAPWYRLEAGTLDADQKFAWRDGRLSLHGKTDLKALRLGAAEGPTRHFLESVVLDADLDATPELDGEGTLKLTVRGARSEGIEGIDGPLNLGSVDVDARLESGRKLAVKKAEVNGDLLRLNAGGDLILGDDLPRGDFTLRLETALDKLARFLGDRQDLAGALTSDFKLTTSESGAVSIRGGTKILNLRARAGAEGPEINEREVLLQHDLDYDDRKIDLKDIRLDASFAKAKAGGSLDLGEDENADPTGRIDVDADADLDRVAALLGDLIPAELHGRLNLKGQLRGVQGGTDFDARIVTQGFSVKTEALGKEPFDVGRLNAELAGSMRTEGGVLDVPRFKLDGDLATAEGRLRQTSPENGDGTLELALDGRVDLDRLATPFLDSRPRSALARSQVSLALNKVGDLVRLTKANLSAASTRLSATGDIRLGEVAETAIDYTYEGELADLSPYLATFEEPINARGRMQSSGRLVQGAAPSMAAKGSFSNLALSGPGTGDRDIRIARGTFDLASHGGGDAPLSLDKIAAELGGFSKSQADSGTLAGDLKMNGGLAANGDFDFRLDGTNMVVTPANATPIRLSRPLAVTAKGKQDPAAGIYDIQDLRIDADGVSARGKGSWLPSERFTIETSADLENAGFARTWLSSFFEDVEGSGKGRLELSADVPLGKDADGAKTQGSLLATMDSLTIEGFTLSQLDMKGNLVNGVGSLEKGDARLNEGPAKLKLNVDLRPEDALIDFGVNAQDVKVVKRMQPTIARVIPLFAGVGAEVETTLNIDLDVNGQGNAMDPILQTLTGGGSFSAAAGSVRGGPIITAVMGALGAPGRIDFNTLATQIKIENGAVIQEGLNIDGSVVDLKLSGRTFFDGRLDYALGVKPEPGKVKEWDKFSPLVAADGFLPLGLGGNVSSPSPKLPDPAQLIEGAAKNAIGNALNGLLGGEQQGGEKKTNPLESLFGGGKKDADGEKKPRNPLESLLGGSKKKDGEKKKKKNPLEGLLGGGGGR